MNYTYKITTILLACSDRGRGYGFAWHIHSLYLWPSVRIRPQAVNYCGKYQEDSVGLSWHG